MKEPRLTDADFVVLQACFAYAHLRGRLTDDQHDLTVTTLAEAKQRQRENDVLARFAEVMG